MKQKITEHFSKNLSFLWLAASFMTLILMLAETIHLEKILCTLIQLAKFKPSDYSKRPEHQRELFAQYDYAALYNDCSRQYQG